MTFMVKDIKCEPDARWKGDTMKPSYQSSALAFIVVLLLAFQPSAGVAGAAGLQALLGKGDAVMVEAPDRRSIFRDLMAVSLVNDGPVTLIVESK